MALALAYKGFDYVDYFNGEYSDFNTLPGVEATGANGVALTPDYGIDVADSTIYAGGATTDTIADLTLAIDDAADDGLTAFVRPLVDYLYPQESPAFPGTYYVPDFDSSSDPSGYVAANVPAGVTPATVPAAAYSAGDTTYYRGFLSPSDIDTTKFFGSATTVGSYDYMIVQEATAAQKAGAKLFAVGTELDSLADDPGLTGDWYTLIADVRAVFTGKLTYSANWSTASEVTFWNKLDYVGIDGYVPLSNTIPSTAAQNPTLASLEAGWNTVSNVDIAYSGGVTVGTQLGGLSAIDAFDTLAQQSIDKQFLFSEIGYQNDTSAAADPTGGSNRGVTDPTLQAELSAFFDAWGAAQATAAANGGKVDGIPYSLVGAYFWDWNPNTSAAGYDDWSPVGYPAQAAVEEGFATPSGPVVAPEKGSAGLGGTPAVGTAGTAGTGALDGDSDPTSSTLTITAVSANGVVGTVGTDGGPPSPLQTKYGSIALNSDGSYRYYAGMGTSSLASAPIGAPVADVIDFTVTDGAGDFATSKLMIEDYREPTAAPETGAIVAGGTLDATSGTGGTGALRGDFDPDGVALTANVLSDVGKYGTLTLDTDGSYTYVANSPAALQAAFAVDLNAPLEDSFIIIVHGGDSAYATSTLGIAITSNDFTGGGYSLALGDIPGATVYLYSTGNDWDTVAGSEGSVTMTGAQAAISGGVDTIVFAGGSGDAASLYDTAAGWDLVNGSNGTIYLNGAQAAVVGGRDTVDFDGSSGDAVSVYGTTADWDLVNGLHGAIYLNNAQAAVAGGGDTIGFEGVSGNAVSLYDTTADWDLVNGSNGTVYLYNAQAAIVGGGETVQMAAGSGNAASLYDTDDHWDLVNGSDATVYLTSAQAAIVGGADTVDLAGGSGAAVSLYDTSGHWDSVNGSSGSVYLNDAQAGVAGDSDAIHFSGANEVTKSGSSDAFVFQAAIGVDTINGFNSTDSMQFSVSDFADWSALMNHTSQSGSNTVIALDVSNTVTLTSVTASNLTAEQFHFV